MVFPFFKPEATRSAQWFDGVAGLPPVTASFHPRAQFPGLQRSHPAC